MAESQSTLLLRKQLNGLYPLHVGKNPIFLKTQLINYILFVIINFYHVKILKKIPLKDFRPDLRTIRISTTGKFL